jgi:hypothetical protein
MAGANSSALTGTDAGTYQLYVSDSNGCEKYLISYSIGRDPALTVTTNNVQLIDDQCQTGTGALRASAITSPFDGRMKGQDLPVGTYYYIINLNTKCDVISGGITLIR